MTFAPFGYSIFGENVFGAPTSISISSTLTVTPIGYDTLQINWTPPGGQWTQLVLVRSSFGTPTSIYDNYGTILLNENGSTGFSVQYVDMNLQSGHFYYYALFVLTAAAATPQPSEYLLAGAAQGLVLTDYDFADTFQQWVPDWYLEQDSTLATTAQPQGPLVRFLELIGYEMDWIRSEIESLFLLTNVEQISGALLPAMGGNLGVTYEPALGMTRSRVLVQNAVFLYKNRGTQIGVESAGSAFSGYGCVTTDGKNLEIQLDDAAFDQSVGHWAALNTQTHLSIIAAATAGVTPPHTAYAPMPTDPESGIEGYLPPNNENVLEMTANGAICSMSTCTSANSQTIGIPITQQATPATVSISAYFYPVSTLRQVFMQIDWYAVNGALISSSVGSTITEVASTWTRAHVSAQPPAGAYTFGRTVKSVASWGTDIHYMDAEQVELAAAPTSWQPPRDIQLNFLPVRQNLITNTQGVVSTAGWAASGGTIAQSAAAVPWPAGASRGFVLTPSGAAIIALQNIPVNAGVVYTWSVWSMPVISANHSNFLVTIRWLNAASGLIKTTSSSNFAESSAGAFVQASLVDQVAPAGAVLAQVEVGIFTVSGQQHYIGAPLFAPEAALLPFFDATFQPTTDYLFESTPNLSVSDYYPALPSRLSRLATVIPDYVPIGSTFSLFVGAPALANIGFLD